MSTPIANPAINTYLQVTDGGCPATFSTVANVGSINGFSMSAMVVDVTSHSNTDAWRRKIATLLDAGTLSFDCYFIFNDTGHKKLLQLFVDRGLNPSDNGTVVTSFQLSIPTAGARTVIAFGGYVTKFNFSFPVDNVVKAQVDITVVGQPAIPGVNE